MEYEAFQRLIILLLICAPLWLGWLLLWRKLRQIEIMLREIRAAIHFEAEKTRRHATGLFTPQTQQPKQRRPRPKHLRLIISRASRN